MKLARENVLNRKYHDDSFLHYRGIFCKMLTIAHMPEKIRHHCGANWSENQLTYQNVKKKIKPFRWSQDFAANTDHLQY